MDILYLLIGISVIAVCAVVGILLWAVRTGQYDDLEGPAWRIVLDDDAPSQGTKAAQHGPPNKDHL